MGYPHLQLQHTTEHKFLPNQQWQKKTVKKKERSAYSKNTNSEKRNAVLPTRATTIKNVLYHS